MGISSKNHPLKDLFPNAMPTRHHGPLLLASTSPYRARLLSRLGIPFEVLDPGVDERTETSIDPKALARTLAARKARAGAALRPSHLTIASDQVASCEGRILGKPGDTETQIAQLRALSGATATFHTAVAVVPPGTGGRSILQRLATTRVRVRPLDDAAIRRYVAAEPATDCCGGFKCEGLGIALFARIQATDPTALEGLPLIATAQLLRRAGVTIP